MCANNDCLYKLLWKLTVHVEFKSNIKNLSLLLESQLDFFSSTFGGFAHLQAAVNAATARKNGTCRQRNAILRLIRRPFPDDNWGIWFIGLTCMPVRIPFASLHGGNIQLRVINFLSCSKTRYHFNVPIPVCFWHGTEIMYVAFCLNVSYCYLLFFY